MEGQPDWTVPLFQLEEYPVGLEIDPMTATDADIIDYLRATQQRRESENAALGIGIIPSEVVNAHLASLHPSELPRCFVAAALQWNTPHGLWKHKKQGGHTVVRVRPTGGELVSGRGPYIGVKRTLEFYQPDGAKTGWAVIQYKKEEKLIFYKVSELRADGNLHYRAPLHLATNLEQLFVEYTGSLFDDLDNLFANFNPEQQHPIYGDLRLSPLPGDQLYAGGSPSDYFNDDEVLMPLPEPEARRGRKRMRSRSAVWENFAKIDGKDPQDVYAACLSCDGLLKAHTKKQSTSPLWNHYKMHLRAAV